MSWRSPQGSLEISELRGAHDRRPACGLAAGGPELEADSCPRRYRLKRAGCGRESEVRGARRMQHNVFVSVSGKGEERRIVTERYGHDDPIDNLSQTRSRPLP